MEMTDATWPEVCAHYEEIGRQVVGRALRLKAPGLVLEFELLPPMTERPEWGAELTRILKGPTCSKRMRNTACRARCG